MNLNGTAEMVQLTLRKATAVKESSENNGQVMCSMGLSWSRHIGCAGKWSSLFQVYGLLG